MKTITSSLALAAMLGFASPSPSQAEDAHHSGGHHSSHGQPSYGHNGHYSGHNQHGSQHPSYTHRPVHSNYNPGSYRPSYGHGGNQPSYGHSGYRPSYGNGPSHNGGHISLPGIHLNFGGHSRRH